MFASSISLIQSVGRITAEGSFRTDLQAVKANAPGLDPGVEADTL